MTTNDDTHHLDCPQCGADNAECGYEMLHFDCTCGCAYDWAVCQSCGETVGSDGGDDCPVCGRPLEVDPVSDAEDDYERRAYEQDMDTVPRSL